jgi:hypothetical protein
VHIEADAETWDRQLADELIARTLEQIADADLVDGENLQALEDQVNASYEARRMAALREALEDYAAAVMGSTACV